MLRLDLDEVDIEPVDVGDEVRIGEQLRFGAAPIVVVGPVIRELLRGRQADPLRGVVDGLALGPPSGFDAPLEVGEFFVGRVILERADRGVATGLGGGADNCAGSWRDAGRNRRRNWFA